MEFFREFGPLVGVNVADGAEVEVPSLQRRTLNPCMISSLRRARGGCASDKQIYQMFTALIDDRRRCLAINIVETATDQRKALRCQVDHRRGQGELAVEPGLDGMLVARFDIGEMAALQ